MTRYLLLCLLALGLLLPSAPAQAEEMEAVADLAEDFIPVTEDFDGAHMTVFGAVRSSKSDIVVAFTGPKAKAQIRPKVKKFGLWVNGEPQVLDPVPSFYAVLSSRPLNVLLKPETLKALSLGLDTLPLEGEAGRGLIENRLARGLYRETPDGVKIRSKKLFRADIDLPPNVPVGSYNATIYEIKNGAVIASRDAAFRVQPIGLASSVRYLAAWRPTLYAALSVVLALLFGGVGAYAFRKAS